MLSRTHVDKPFVKTIRKNLASKSNQANESFRITFGKYKGTRHWAIWINDELIVVTVYRKGAKSVLRLPGLEDAAIELQRPKLLRKWR